MSSNQILETVNAPRRALSMNRQELNSPNCVRVYRNSPEDISLQLRRRKDYITIALMPGEARELAARLIALADELERA